MSRPTTENLTEPEVGQPLVQESPETAAPTSHEISVLKEIEAEASGKKAAPPVTQPKTPLEAPKNGEDVPTVLAIGDSMFSNDGSFGSNIMKSIALHGMHGCGYSVSGSTYGKWLQPKFTSNPSGSNRYDTWPKKRTTDSDPDSYGMGEARPDWSLGTLLSNPGHFCPGSKHIDALIVQLGSNKEPELSAAKKIEGILALTQGRVRSVRFILPPPIRNNQNFFFADNNAIIKVLQEKRREGIDVSWFNSSDPKIFQLSNDDYYWYKKKIAENKWVKTHQDDTHIWGSNGQPGHGDGELRWSEAVTNWLFPQISGTDPANNAPTTRHI